MALPTPKFGATALNNFGLRLKGKRWNDQDWQAPEFTFDQVNNMPRIVVWPRNPAEKEKTNSRGRPLSTTPITCNMRWSDFFKLILVLEMVVESSTPTTFTFGFKSPKYENGEKVRGEFEIRAKLDIGRNAEGEIFMRIYEKGRDKAVVLFSDNFWVPITQDGNELSKSLNSNLAVKGFFKTIDAMAGPTMVAYYVPEIRQGKDPDEDKKDKVEMVTASGDSWD